MFEQIHVLAIITNGMKPRQRFVLVPEYYEVYFTLYILYIFAYCGHSLYMAARTVVINVVVIANGL